MLYGVPSARSLPLLGMSSLALLLLCPYLHLNPLTRLFDRDLVGVETVKLLPVQYRQHDGFDLREGSSTKTRQSKRRERERDTHTQTERERESFVCVAFVVLCMYEVLRLYSCVVCWYQVFCCVFGSTTIIQV